MKPLSHITVLVAEDERPVRMLLRVVLETAGARVLEAEHGSAALRLLDLHPEIDVLCTDMNMPQMGGEDLIRAVRARRPELPVVTCTAIDLETSTPMLAMQVDAMVQKPFVPSELIRAVDHATTQRVARLGA